MRNRNRLFAAAFLVLALVTHPLFAQKPLPPRKPDKNSPCKFQCEVFYANCKSGRTGPKGGWKNPAACEIGRERCKQTCPR